MELGRPLPEVAFVQNMKRRREELGISQTEMAQRLRDKGYPFHQQTIQRIESEEEPRPLRLGEAIAVAEILQTTVTDLMRSAGGFIVATVSKQLQLQVAHHLYEMGELKARLEAMEAEASQRRYESAKEREEADRVVNRVRAVVQALEISAGVIAEARFRDDGDIGPIVKHLTLEPSDGEHPATP